MVAELAVNVQNDILFLTRSQIFGDLAPDCLWAILEKGCIETYSEPGSILFINGDPADALYVIKSGVVEICRTKGEDGWLVPVAYLGESETIGEMAIFTDSRRGSVARVSQTAEVFRIEKSVFMTLLRQFPDLRMSFLAVISKRLENHLRQQRIVTRYQHLSGNLKYFDLTTIIQTLANSQRSGTLIIEGPFNRTFAQIYFDNGCMRYARFGHLKGKEAVCQIFQSPVPEKFSFNSGRSRAEFTKGEEIRVPTTRLLLECVYQKDELRSLKLEYPDRRRRFRKKVDTLMWPDHDTLVVAKQVWQHLRLNESIHQMVGSIPYSEYSVYSVLSQMHKRGLII